jgi:hypothetical protein
MPTDKKSLRTTTISFFWRWWDEAEHKSTPEKRLAYYDALMRYIFRGEVPGDPNDMEDPTGVDYAAYDASHYFDVIDSLVERSETRGRGGQPGNQNARKTNPETNRNESENESPKTNRNESERKNKTKNESLLIKNQESRIKNNIIPPVAPPRGADDVGAAGFLTTRRLAIPTREDVMLSAHNLRVPADFAAQFYDDMVRDEWVYVNRNGKTVEVKRNNLSKTLWGRWAARSGEDAADGDGDGESPEVRAALELARKAAEV